MEQSIILNKIDLSSFNRPKAKVVHYDECNDVVNTSFGETRTRVERKQDGVTTFFMYCNHCINEHFGKHEADTIFD